MVYPPANPQMGDSVSFAIIAHRGFSSQAPENTLAAFDLALASGFRNIEFDVHLSSDGVPVVIHDPTVNRTTDGTGKISKMPISVIRELDAGSWFSPPQEFAFQNEKVPELEEVLLRYHGLAHLYIELKSEEPELVENVHYLLEHTGWLKGKRKKSANESSSLWIISFNLQQLTRSKQSLPDLSHGYLVLWPDTSTLDVCAENKFEKCFPHISGINPAFLDAAQEKGVSIGIWGASAPAEILQAKNLGVSSATVDWPDTVRTLLSLPE